jgi:hypothetical protein
MRTAAAWFLIGLAACSGKPSSKPAAVATPVVAPADAPAVAPPADAAPADAAVSSVAARCEAANTYAAFRGCKRWRVANEAACGNGPGPAAYDPCHCMCDLCDGDEDCAKGERCVSVSSVMVGGMEQRACVGPKSPCYPDSKLQCPPGKACRNYDGHPRCDTAHDEIE